MRKLSILTLLAVLASFLSTASAGVLVEPVVGYNIGGKLDFDGADSYSGGSGSAFGGRLGYQNLGFQLGLDYLHSSIDMDDDDFDSNLSMDEWAGFVGFEFPILLRAYVGYIFSATGEIKDANEEKLELLKGSGTKFGIGFTGLPFIDINVEYRTGTFGEQDYLGVEDKDDVKYQAVMIGLSAPFNL